MPREVNSLNNILFDPSVNRKKRDAAPVRELTLSNADSSATSQSGSFRFDSPGSGLKSTQQLNVDFSKFQNHTFFGSAQAKVQRAFDKIINNYPFDGQKFEVDAFVDDLSGFEKYVFDSFPKSKGYLNFSGSSGTSLSEGTYLKIFDFQGASSPTLSKNPTGESVLDFGTSPFTIEFYLRVPSGSINQNTVLLQKISESNGLTIALSSSHSQASPFGTAPLSVILTSGTQVLTASMTIEKGVFSHCAFVFDKQAGPGQFKLYRDGALVSSSTNSNFGAIDFKRSMMTVGSGTSVNLAGFSFQAESTLSGAMDELRFWHKSKTQKEIYSEMSDNVFAQPALKAYYKFNEPSGSFASNGGDLVLDHSGNGLHTRVSNFHMNLRSSSSNGPTPLLGESDTYSPVLFPSYNQVIDLNTILLISASDYDYNNPNLVTKLIPPHYFLESQIFEGFEAEAGDISNTLSLTADQPGGGKVGKSQIISSLLYIMSEAFDDLKMFVDEFRRLLKVDYLTTDTVSDQLLPWLSNYYGVSLPGVFSAASLSQMKDGKNVSLGGQPTMALQAVQNMMWRRVLSDLPKTFAARGTIESIKSTLRNLGINADGPIRIRELGGAKSLNLGDSFIKRNEIAAMLDFSGSIDKNFTAVNAQGFDSSIPYLTSSFLSGSRVEPGFPQINGSFIDGISNNVNDGLYTSGSWTFEGVYRFVESLDHENAQSLVRICTTGTLGPAATSGLIMFNLVASPDVLESNTTGSIQLWGRTSYNLAAPSFMLNLTGVNIMDGDKWYVSFGRQRNDQISSYVSSSYFLRAGKFTAGGLEQYISTASYFNDYTHGDTECLLQNISSYNTSGSFFVLGKQSITSSASTQGLNSTTAAPDISRTTSFTGKVSGLRFWSKALEDKEAKMHTKNFKSLGVADPSLNFNFVSNVSGSFEKIRCDLSVDQIVTQSDNTGAVKIFDFSQNQKDAFASGFESLEQVIKPERFDFEVLAHDFKSDNPNKIRIRSYLDPVLAQTYNVPVGPLYAIPPNETPKDDKRVQVEISALQALNEDIMNIFATLDYLDNAIGSPELVFAQEYPTLRNLRRIYFNRLTEKVKLAEVFQFFKWFDDTAGELLEQMLPYDSKFIGTSFVVEPHALERPKFVYKFYDIYLGEENRGGKDLLLLQQLSGLVRKF